MQATNHWQVRRAKGRRIYTGLSRTQVQRALAAGKLKPDDMALPPGASNWMNISAALSQFIDSGTTEHTELTVPDWVPMREEGRLAAQDGDGEDPAEMDMLAMVDITMLLLIFFLVSGVLMPQARVELPEAQTGTPEMFAENKPVNIVIEPDPDDPSSGKISFEEERSVTVAPDDLVQEYNQRVQAGSLPEVVLKAHRHVPFGIVREVMATLTEAGVGRISVAIEER